MAGVISNYLGNAMLQEYLSNATGLYLALHTSDPTVTGLLSTEVSGGGYARQHVTFSAASGKDVANTNTPIFSSLPACTVQYLAVWDTVSNGNMYCTIDISGTPIAVLVNGEIHMAVGDIAVGL